MHLENEIVQPKPEIPIKVNFSENKTLASVSWFKHYFREFDPGSG